MKTLFAIIFLISAYNAIFCQDKYVERKFDNLTVKIQLSDDDITTDKAFICAEYCAYLTNNIYPDQKIHLEINTQRTENKEDYFLSFGNAKTEVFNVIYESNRKGELVPKREFIGTDSMKCSKLVVRCFTQTPDYIIISRLILNGLSKIDFIKENQKEITFSWLRKELIMQSIDAFYVDKWKYRIPEELGYKSIDIKKNYSSEVCRLDSSFSFNLVYMPNGFLITKKDDTDKSLKEFSDLIWFSIKDEFGVFMISDTSFFIADSYKETLSDIIYLPIRINEFHDISFRKRTKYGIQLSLYNYFDHVSNSWVIRSDSNVLIDVSGLKEKEIIKICSETYWH